MINIDFVFSPYIKKIIKEQNLYFEEKTNLKDVKGIYIHKNKEVFINLSAVQWKNSSTPVLINNIKDTIVHEVIHNQINSINPKRTDAGEERVCILMAEQDLDFNFKGL